LESVRFGLLGEVSGPASANLTCTTCEFCCKKFGGCLAGGGFRDRRIRSAPCGTGGAHRRSSLARIRLVLPEHARASGSSTGVGAPTSALSRPRLAAPRAGLWSRAYRSGAGVTVWAQRARFCLDGQHPRIVQVDLFYPNKAVGRPRGVTHYTAKWQGVNVNTLHSSLTSLFTLHSLHSSLLQRERERPRGGGHSLVWSRKKLSPQSQMWRNAPDGGSVSRMGEACTGWGKRAPDGGSVSRMGEASRELQNCTSVLNRWGWHARRERFA
jgi:hypothetical protein